LLAMTKSERTVEIEVCIKLISFLLVSSAWHNVKNSLLKVENERLLMHLRYVWFGQGIWDHGDDLNYRQGLSMMLGCKIRELDLWNMHMRRCFCTVL
jgi:hypothetical protein